MQRTKNPCLALWAIFPGSCGTRPAVGPVARPRARALRYRAARAGGWGLAWPRPERENTGFPSTCAALRPPGRSRFPSTCADLRPPGWSWPTGPTRLSSRACSSPRASSTKSGGELDRPKSARRSSRCRCCSSSAPAPPRGLVQSTGAETSPASSLDITGRSLSLKTRIDDVELLLGYSMLCSGRCRCQRRGTCTISYRTGG